MANPAQTYGLWDYYGNKNTYRINNNTQFRVNAISSGDIGDHALQMVRIRAAWDGYCKLNPIGLWTLARLTTTRTSKKSTLVTALLTNEAVTTSRDALGDNQFEFDYNLRNKLEAGESSLWWMPLIQNSSRSTCLVLTIC